MRTFSPKKEFTAINNVKNEVSIEAAITSVDRYIYYTRFTYLIYTLVIFKTVVIRSTHTSTSLSKNT